MSFTFLFDSYKNLLCKKEFEDKKESGRELELDSVRDDDDDNIDDDDSCINFSDIQSATKKIFTIAVQQNADTLNKVSFYDTLSSYFIIETDDKLRCTNLLKEIGWDLLTELFLLYTRDCRFSNFLFSICWDISPRELSIMFSEVFSHPILSISATHHYYQLHTIQNHYILNGEDSESQKQMMNLNISNQSINMDASDDILSFHKNINYIRIQTIFIKCICILFKRLTNVTTSKYAINHFYQSLIPSAILHFQTLSKEVSYQFYLHNATQYATHHEQGGSGGTGQYQLDATKKQRQDWLINSKDQYEEYLKQIYKLFGLMVNNHCNLNINDNQLKDVPVNVDELIKCFQPSIDDLDDDDDEKVKAEKLQRSNNMNTLWLARYGFGVLSGVYWWYNVFFMEDIENDGDVNNDSQEILHNIKKPAYNIFITDIVDGLKTEILVKLTHSVGMNGNLLLTLREYLTKLENKLESLKPWHLSSDQIQSVGINKSNPSTPTPVLQPMSSIGHPDLNTIVEEQEDIDDIMAATNDDKKDGDDDKSEIKKVVHTAAISKHDKPENDGTVIINGVKEEEEEEQEENIDDDDDGGGWDDDDDDDNDGDIGFGDIDASKLKKVQETQALVDELKEWNEYLDIFGVACYYHSLWVLLGSTDCIENGAIIFNKHSKHIWKCIQLLFEQLTTLPAGIEFGEFILNITIGKMGTNDLIIKTKSDLDKLLNTAQFHEQGLWALCQYLTSQLKGITDRALHQKLWKFIVHLINAADLKTRFQCIVSTALQCPIPVVQSLMFTELKNQIFNNWNIDLDEKENKQDINNNANDDDGGGDNDDGLMMMEDTLNPFCSRQVVMVLVQRLGKELQNMTLENIYQELDSLNACLNLCRFLLAKDKETNYTQIYDDDCPLKQVIQTLYEEMTKIGNDEDISKNDNNNNKHSHDELEEFQRQMMKNQFLVSLDLVKRIQEMYK